MVHQLRFGYCGAPYSHVLCRHYLSYKELTYWPEQLPE